MQPQRDILNLKPKTAITPTLSQLLAAPPDKVAEKLLEAPTLTAAKLMALLPADRAAEVIKAMKEKTRETVEGKPPTPTKQEEEE